MSAGPPAIPLDRGLESRVRLLDGARMPVFGLGVWRSPAGAGTRDAVAEAIAAGYRLFDTAAMYGNEADVGSAIRASGVARDEIFVTTKVWNDDQGYEPTLRAFERSERALGIGPIDLYLVHWPVPHRWPETWRALLRLQRDGRCRSVGVSNFTLDHLAELERGSPTLPVVDQVEFHPFLYQRELLAGCRTRGIQLEAYAPLVRGRRMDHPTLRSVAETKGRTVGQILLRWALQHGVIVIPKSVRAERIRENARVFDFALTADEMAQIDGCDERLRTSWDPTTLR